MAATNKRRTNGHRRTQLSLWLRSQGRPCWICRAFGKQGAIDYSLPPGHPYCFEVDELVPVSLGGDPYDRDNVDAAHRCCNQWRGNKSVEEVLRLASKPTNVAAAGPCVAARGTTTIDW